MKFEFAYERAKVDYFFIEKPSKAGYKPALLGKSE